MKPLHYIFAAILFLALTACEQQPPASAEQQTVSFAVLAQGTQSGFKTEMPTAYKLDNEKDWQTFWEQHNSTVEPKPTLPKVDFSKDMIIAIVDANEPSGGYQIVVEKITSYNHRSHITAVREEPGPNCMTLGAITQPFIFVVVPQSQDVPELHLDTRVTDCK